MTRFLEHPSFVPCPACGNTVSKGSVLVELKMGSGLLIIEGVPQYECECGSLFIPQETESLIASLQQEKKTQIKGKKRINYEDLRRKGKRAIR